MSQSLNSGARMLIVDIFVALMFFPCNASELVHFRNRIGEKGVELILKESIRVNDDGNDNTPTIAFIDSTVQEKNITYPTDAKLHKKIIKKCQSIAKRENITVRQTYTRTIKALSLDQRFRNHPKNKRKAIKADRKARTRRSFSARVRTQPRSRLSIPQSAGII